MSGAYVWPSGFGNQFTRIHQVIRIDRALDRAHHVERGAVLGLEILQLAEANAMLAAAGAAELQGAVDEPLAEPRDLRQLLLIVGIEHDDQMEVAVAGVADERRFNAGLLEIFLRLENAFGEVRDRHANVGRPRAGARPRCDGGVVGVMSRLPERIAILERGRPLEFLRAVLARDFFDGADLIFNRDVADAVEL